MTIAIQPINDSSVTYYADSGTPVPSGYRQVPFEGSEARDFSLNSRDTGNPITGTVNSSDMPSWIAEKLATLGIGFQAPQFGMGAVNQGMQSAGMSMPSLQDANNFLKDAAGPTAGGMAGATIGGMGATALLGPEAAPLGMYLGGAGGAGIGEGLSNLLRYGEARPEDMAKVAALDLILGPAMSGGISAGNAIMRRLGLKSDLVKEAAQSGASIKMGKLDTAAQYEKNVKPPPVVPADAKLRNETLDNVLDIIKNQGRGVNFEMNPYAADSLRARIGKAGERGAFEDTSKSLYGAYMRDLRAQAYLENNPAAQALVQKGIEENALRAVKSGFDPYSLGAGAGLGGLGSFMAYRFMNNPLQASIAAGLGLTVPPLLRMAPGLSKAGFSNVMMNPYVYGLVPGIGAGEMGIGE